MTDFDDTPAVPTSLRDRIAYALCAHDTYGGDRFTQLSDDQLQELTDIVTFLHTSPAARGMVTAWTRTLVAEERRARGWTHDESRIHFSYQGDIVEARWREWRPLADVAMSVLMEIPEVAARARLDAHLPDRPQPDPPPPPPAAPPGLQKPTPPPKKRRANKKAA